MSIASSMTTAVSALKAESQALSTVANNLANSSTVGYKANSTRFISLVTSSYTDNTAASGAGVTAVTRQNVTDQGSISGTTSTTDLAIDGNGFFALTRKSNGPSTPTQLYYSRDGEFSVDSSGYLSLGNDYYVEGYANTYDSASGKTTPSSNLAALQVTDGKEKWMPTSRVALDANLPMSMSTASVANSTDSSVSTTTTVYDSTGSSHSVTMTFVTDHTTADQWTVSLSSSDSAVSFTPASYNVSFSSSNGAIAVVDGSTTDFSPLVTIADGGVSQSVSFDFTDLTQYNSGTDISLTSLTQNGYPPSSYTGVTVDTAGVVTSTYASGLTITVGKVVLANFANSNGLNVLNDGMYQESTTSGPVMLGTAGQNGTGTIKSEALEASTTDTGTEFTRMIVAQQAYSAASQVISTSKSMYEDLVSAVR